MVIYGTKKGSSEWGESKPTNSHRQARSMITTEELDLTQLDSGTASGELRWCFFSDFGDFRLELPGIF